jgi:hypothetical protein
MRGLAIYETVAARPGRGKPPYGGRRPRSLADGQRPHLPLGMAVSFEKLPAEAETALTRYVEERSHAFEV